MLKRSVYFGDPHFQLKHPHLVCSGDDTVCSLTKPENFATATASNSDLLPVLICSRPFVSSVARGVGL